MMHMGAQQAWAAQRQTGRPQRKHSQDLIHKRHRQQTVQPRQQIAPQLLKPRRQQSSRHGMLSARCTQAAGCTRVSLASQP